MIHYLLQLLCTLLMCHVKQISWISKHNFAIFRTSIELVFDLNDNYFKLYFCIVSEMVYGIISNCSFIVLPKYNLFESDTELLK